MQPVTENIFYETDYPGVTLGAVILPGGTLIVDAPLRAEDARAWKSALLTKSRGAHRMLISLDAHTDRIIGTRYMECTLLTHREVLNTIKSYTAVFKGQPTGSSSEWEHYPEVSGTRWFPPNITFSQQMKLHWGGSGIIIEHHPGPDPGASWIIIPDEKVLFLGDTILVDQPPFLATSSLPQWIAAISELRVPRYREYTFVSGRGGPVGIEYVREQHEHFRWLHRRLESLAARGAPPEDTEALIDPYLGKINFDPALRNSYAQRLRYGLDRYYRRHYLPEGQETSK